MRRAFYPEQPQSSKHISCPREGDAPCSTPWGVCSGVLGLAAHFVFLLPTSPVSAAGEWEGVSSAGSVTASMGHREHGGCAQGKGLLPPEFSPSGDLELAEGMAGRCLELGVLVTNPWLHPLLCRAEPQGLPCISESFVPFIPLFPQEPSRPSALPTRAPAVPAAVPRLPRGCWPRPGRAAGAPRGCSGTWLGTRPSWWPCRASWPQPPTSPLSSTR